MPISPAVGHFIIICRVCGGVISQCRCPSPDKTTMTDICPKCRREGKG